MPTYERRLRFDRDYDRLTDEEKAAFRRSVRRFLTDLHSSSGRFHRRLRIHRIDARLGVGSLTALGDGLAEHAAVMSAVNWAEVLSRLASACADPDEVAQRLASERPSV